MTGLSRLVRAQVSLSLEMCDALPGQAPQLIAPIDLGWDDESARQRYYRYYQEGEPAIDPAAQELVDRHTRVGLVSATRREVVGDREWYASPTVSEARFLGQVDDFVCSSATLAPGVLTGFIFYRVWGDKPFAVRERRLVRFFHLSLLREIRRSGMSRSTAHITDLSPRLRQTIDLLVAGNSMKQVAAALGISRHTVNDYTKIIYERMDVSSRGELVGKIVSQQTRTILLPAELTKRVNGNGRHVEDRVAVSDTDSI
jgi:DNA-binding CsgD family transcriptional regulator